LILKQGNQRAHLWYENANGIQPKQQGTNSSFPLPGQGEILRRGRCYARTEARDFIKQNNLDWGRGQRADAPHAHRRATPMLVTYYASKQEAVQFRPGRGLPLYCARLKRVPEVGVIIISLVTALRPTDCQGRCHR
jgi:hypothetical protein